MTRTVCIDDTDASRYLISRTLRQAGHEVVEGSTAAEALRLVRRERPDLVLLDVNLPDGSGAELCAAIRRDPLVAHTPVILVSATAIDQSDRISGLNLGADAYLTEPIDAGELIAVVNALLRTSQAEREVNSLNERLAARVAELEALISTVPIGIALSSDPECRDIRANPPLAAMLNLKTEDNVSLSADEAERPPYTVLRNGRAVLDRDLPMQRTARTGEIVKGEELEIVRADGSRTVLLSYASPTVDASGRVVGTVGAYVDITESKREEMRQAMLADAAMLLADALELETTVRQIARVSADHLADWCIVDVASDSGRLRNVAHRDPAKSEAALRLRDTWQLETSQDLPCFAAYELQRPQLVHRTEPALLADERLREVVSELGMRSVIATPLLARGKCLGVLTFVAVSREYDELDLNAAKDLALRGALAIDNAMLYRAAQEANRAKDEFLATVSHELRTPLTSIAGWIGILRHDPTDVPLVEQSAVELERSSNTLRRLVDDLLDVARVTSGKLQLESRAVDLATITSRACEALRLSAAAKSVRLRLEPTVESLVAGDPLRLHQIVSNLLGNAIKFTPSGGEVHVSLDGDSERCVLRVADTGQGIEGHFLPHLFERFSQQNPSSATGGLGIGLALVKELTELHGGHVYAESAGAGHGATFTVVLPRLSSAAAR